MAATIVPPRHATITICDSRAGSLDFLQRRRNLPVPLHSDGPVKHQIDRGGQFAFVARRILSEFVSDDAMPSRIRVGFKFVTLG